MSTQPRKRAPRPGEGRPSKYDPDQTELVTTKTEPQEGLSAIYVLLDGEDVRYVGKTKMPAKRFQDHIRSGKVGKTHRERWIAKACAADTFQMRIVEWTENWDEAERAWIAGMRQQRTDLLNIAAGGLDMARAHEKIGATLFSRLVRFFVNMIINADDPGFKFRMRGHVEHLKSVYASLKREKGDDAANEWGNWLFYEMKLDRHMNLKNGRAL